MNEVWKELQEICMKFNGAITDEELGARSGYENENSGADHEILLSQQSFGTSSDCD
jgi:hypothetical protein